MSYTCPKCKEQVDGRWCESCNQETDHTCDDFTTDRIKDFHYGDEGDYTTKITITYCDECGFVSGVDHGY